MIASTVLLSGGVEAGIVSVGSLQTSKSSHFITDTKSGIKYSKLDKNLGLTYAELLSELSDTTSNWYGWKIAASEDNDNFLNAMFSFSGGSQCFGVAPQNSYCGTVSGWTDGMLGLNFISYYDVWLYKRTIDSTNSNPFFFGKSIIEHNGEVRKADDSMHLSIYDRYFSHPVDGISILLVNDS